MIVADIIARLQSLSPPVFRIVAGALELASVPEQPPATPAAYVFIESEAAAENETATGAVRQRVEADVAVVMVASNVASAAGGALAADVEVLKRKVIEALVGWLAPSGEDVITFVGSELRRAKGGYVACQLTFSAPYYLEVR